MSKYGNRRTTVDGWTFDSKAEADRYRELKLLQASGAIRNLEVHPRFEIIPAFRAGDGTNHRATFYEADFQYHEWHGDHFWIVVEDVKGVQTEAFKIKRKLFLREYPYRDFRIIEA